jgi:HD-GYP domain-containing protein (c-di-GMP phosphodiesterase class II)
MTDSLAPRSPERRSRRTAERRVSISVLPALSPIAATVREAARQLGIEFVRARVDSPSAVADRLFVVDLTQRHTLGRLGPRVIAVSQRLDLDCYDVVPPSQIRWRLHRAIRNLVDRERLRRQLLTERATIETLNEIGYALSAQTSRSELLDTVLTRSREALRADGGSIYLVDGDCLRFTCSQNDTIPFRASRLQLPLDGSSLAGFVTVTGEALNIADVYAIPAQASYRPNLAFDRETGYRTRSMLLVPMKDRDNVVIGVLALVNRKQRAGEALASWEQIEPFTDADAVLAGSIASQAAVAIENYRLYREIRTLFDGFVDAAVTAIEARDPSTGGHSHRVATLTLALAEALDATSAGPFRDHRFSRSELTELHYAAMLHDFGKVGVREEVLLKANKLFDWELQSIEARFRIARLQVMLEVLREGMAAHERDPLLAQLDDDLALVRRLNRPGSRPTATEADRLNAITEQWQLDTEQRLVQPREARRLCIPLGSLDPEERLEIESHVTHTWQFLRAIPWTRELARVPELAYCHHEKLDGTGYPRQLSGDSIPLGARLMTVADIFDALTAGDRPYKAGMTPEVALHILREEAERGHIEPEAVEILAQRQLWTSILPPAASRASR